ncbi:SusC/RagA family TonB-linked outer membrane protein [Sphingobacterium psychroaquaticum]|uniref:SusC/RagA family TonB-linked outer membrane protein n=1 Tax=Sphingobacterium psychroaquaticum TaxID=561061 RepID=UPI00141A726A|nr:SusC/RagA family TonB-linked outer membrane protein [Sphingobacterium psychroaquaticum]
MKFIIILLTTAVFQVSAFTTLAQNITLNKKNAQLNTIIKEIRSQSGYDFIYNLNLLKSAKPVSIDVRNASLTTVLDLCFKDQPFTYVLEGKAVIVKERVATNQPKKENVADAVQTTDIKGNVLDEHGKPLVGAIIRVKGTGMVTVTDKSGNFYLKNAPESCLLLISYVGYQLKAISNAHSLKDIQLSIAEDTLHEITVVSTGYQKLEQRLMTGSSVTLAPEKFLTAGVTTIDGMLQGKVTGLAVTNSSGSPNSKPKMRIRGTSTFIGNQAPIWVVDGIVQEDGVDLNPLQNEAGPGNATERMLLAAQTANFSIVGNAIAGVNPNDIESITFLKDAAATSIYGVRAANGVIVITTKRGKAGEKPVVSYATDFGITGKPSYNMFDLMNAKERVDVSREIINSNYSFQFTPLNLGYEGALTDLLNEKISKEEFRSQVATLETRNTDWMDLLFNNAFNQNHTMSLSGGSNKSTYYASIGYNNNKGSAIGDNLNRYTGSLRITSELSKRLRVDLKLNGGERKSKGYFWINPFTYAYKTSRTIDPNMYYVTSASTSYDVALPLTYNFMNERDHTGNTSESREMHGTLEARYKVIDGLEFTSLFGYNYTNNDSRQWGDDRSYYIAQRRGYDYGAVAPGSAEEKASQLPFGGILMLSNINNSNYTWRNTLNYTKRFREEKDILVVMAGQEIRSVKTTGINNVDWGYFPDRGGKLGMDYVNIPGGSLAKHVVSLPNSVNNTVSYFATAAYNFGYKYTVNANMRSDASNRFGQFSRNRFLPIYSVGGKWSIAEENFLKDSRVINVLDLSASYGIQGNVVSNVGPNLIAVYPNVPVDALTGEYYLNTKSIGYKDLRWEKTHSMNVTMHVGLWNNRVSFTGNYYKKRGRDLILTQNIPFEYGFNTHYSNGGMMNNHGLEAMIQGAIIKNKDFNWVLSLNASKNYNQTIKGGAPSQKTNINLMNDYLQGNIVTEGTALNAIYSYNFTGLDPKTGMPLFDVTSKGDPKDPTSFLVYSGKRDPDFTGGFQTMMNYKQFSLSGSFAYNIGNVIRLNPLFSQSGFNYAPQPETNLSAELVNRWRQPGDEAFTNIPSLTTLYPTVQQVALPNGATTYAYTMYDQSTARIVNGDFLRCTNLTFGYTVPANLIKPLHINSLSLRLSGNNLFVIADKRLNGQDPETAGLGGTALPIIPSYNFGLNITL